MTRERVLTMAAAGLLGLRVAVGSEPAAGRPEMSRDNDNSIRVTVQAEDVVYSGRYSNNGASPMWCYGNTCVVRLGDDVFVSGYEHAPKYKPLNDCRWVLLQRTAAGWERQQADEKGRTREPSPLACLPPGRILLSANPTLLSPEASGSGPARPELLEFKAADPKAPPHALPPGWQGNPALSDPSYRSLAADAESGEAILFQNAGYSHAEWALLKADGKWTGGQLKWAPYAKTDLAPFGSSHIRVNYPVIALRRRAVHFCGAAAYDNWDRVKTAADLGLGRDPNAKGASGMGGRLRGNRFRRLLYAWTPAVGEKPFSDWREIDNTFDDGGWLFATDMHVDATGTVHLLWFRSPMLPSVRDALYKDIPRVYSLRHATLRDGKILSRTTLLRAGEGADPAIPTDLDQVGRPYVLWNGGAGERVLGDSIGTARFQVTPDGHLFVVYYVSGKKADGAELSENRLLEVLPDGKASAPVALPLKHPLTQFFTATPRAGCAPSWTLDLLGHRRGGWKPHEGSEFREWDGEMSYARVKLARAPASPRNGPAEPAPDGAPAPAPAHSDVFVAGQDGVHTYRIPAMVLSPSGVILVFCEARKESQSDASPTDMVLRRSTDGGKTWLPTQTLVRGTGTDAIMNPVALVDRETRTVYLVCCNTNRKERDQRRRHVLLSSRDDGVTWSEVPGFAKAVADADDRFVSGPGCGIQTGSGRLVIPGYTITDKLDAQSEKGISSRVIYSDDHGKTWRMGKPVDKDTNESQVVELSDGRLMLNMRQGMGQSCRATAISTDGGESWAPVAFDRALNECPCQASLIVHGRPGADGKRLLAFANPDNSGERYGVERTRMTIRLSYDDGQTWPVKRLVHAGPSSYSGLISLPNGDIGLVFEGGEKHRREWIRFVRLPMGWVTALAASPDKGVKP